MYNNSPSVPVVMSFCASDPSGGAGVQADIEALGAMGCHCVPILTTITSQDTTNMYEFYPCPSHLVHSQARAILEDMPVAAFKIGLLGSIENVSAVHLLLKNYPKIPVVVDPIMRTGVGDKQTDPALLDAIIALVLPYATICTINVTEARSMAPDSDTLDACAHEIMSHGAEHVLITGCEQTPTKTHNSFYGNYRLLETFKWDRLKPNFQGSGCTLSASIAGLLAQQLPPQSAVLQAQQFTAECLKKGYRIGMGHHLPNRLFWARESALQNQVLKN